MEATEIKIFVPWGVIAAKTWGFSTNPIVLLLHGLEDNANSFDYLVEKLPREYYYVSVDLPGHGHSDNLPSLGLPLQAMDYVYVIKLIIDHFERDKYIIIGHSLGAILGLHYGLIYPEKLDKLFIIDTLWFQIVKPTEFGTWTRNKFEEFTKILLQMKRSINSQFTYQQCYDVMNSWRYANCELTPRSVETLLRRSIKPVGNDKYIFTRDPKAKNYLCYPQDERYACEVLKSHNLNFKIVIIMTSYYEKQYSIYFPDLVETYRKLADCISIDGNHHIHLNDPDVVAKVITPYLDEFVSI